MKKLLTMPQIFKNPFYRGKHVVLVKGKAYTAKTGNLALDLLNKLEKKYPDAAPEVAFLPKAKILIL
ncbi:MAG: hypothetical protein AAB838_03745 [Patescibacteria group bacterium]